MDIFIIFSILKGNIFIWYLDSGLSLNSYGPPTQTTPPKLLSLKEALNKNKSELERRLSIEENRIPGPVLVKCKSVLNI